MDHPSLTHLALTLSPCRYLHCINTRIPDVQIFKTFTKNVSANLNVVRYGSVRQWMKSIFDKSYVVIPVFKEYASAQAFFTFYRSGDRYRSPYNFHRLLNSRAI